MAHHDFHVQVHIVSENYGNPENVKLPCGGHSAWKVAGAASHSLDPSTTRQNEKMPSD